MPVVRRLFASSDALQLLIPSRLGEESVVGLCEAYMTELRDYARARYADPDPLALREGILRTVTEIDSRYWTLEGWERSRREVADIMAAAESGPENAASIRLKLLPHAERCFEAADQWATLLAGAGG